jgi:uncharacterized protein DUF5047
VTDRFLTAIRNSTRRISLADIYYSNQLIYSDIPITDGTINVDRSSTIRRSGSFVVSKKNVDPTTLEPWGTEVRIRSGVQYTDRTTELVPLGIFRVEDIFWKDGQDSDITVEFFDRGKALEDAGMLGDRDMSGKYASEALNIVIANVWDHAGYTPSVLIASGLLDIKLPKATVYSGTHLEMVAAVAEAMAGEQYFDVNGDFRVGKIPAITPEMTIDDASWVVDVGEDGDGGVLIEAVRKHSRTETFNAIAVYGATKNDTGGDRVLGVSYDLTTRNHAGYFSPFGKKSKRIENDLLTTQNQCAQVGLQQLKNVAGLAKNVTFTSLLNPALDAGDVVAFRFLDGTVEIHLIDTLSIPLASGEMTGETRAAQYIE